MQRDCFRAPSPDVFRSADLLRRAANAHLLGTRDRAEELLRLANSSEVRDWLESVWGKSSPYVVYRSVPGSPPVLPKRNRLETRMPSSLEKAALLRRDGFVCRFCGLPVIRREVRAHLRKYYPDALPWGRSNESQHSAFQALWAQYDHILPHARGGTNALDNMVIACAACNFGRMNYTLDEVGISDPRQREPSKLDWNGLEDVLPPSRQILLDRLAKCPVSG